MEEFCRKHNLDISQTYEEFSRIYQDTYGVNIVFKMQEDGYHGMPEYLESLGIVERYVEILNGIENMYKRGWR